MSTLKTELQESLADQSLEQRAVNTIRCLAMDAVQKADSGHPGAPMGMADMAYVLWTRFLRFDPEHPQWPDRDRFVLSAGHACMLQYALLYLTGFDLGLDDIKQFRQWGSRTPGHPEYGLTPGIEVTTGPLGQGISNAVGMAAAEAHLAARLNTPEFSPVDHRTYVFASDGDLMEGVQSEAASLAGQMKLGKLIVCYDDNHITIDGDTALAFDGEDKGKRYEAYGWHVQRIDGHDREAVAAALEAARAETGRPSLIVARTHIALGAPNKQDTSEAHGSPLGEEEIRGAKRAYGFDPDVKFPVAADVLEHYRAAGRRNAPAREQWERDFAAWKQKNPEKGGLWDALHDPRIPGDAAGRPTFETGKMIATRSASGKALGWIKQHVPGLVGGSADLEPSNKTFNEGDVAFSAARRDGRYFHFGVREHAMAAIMNGMAVHGGLLPYGGTFLIFSDYLRPSLRLAAFMKAHVVYVFTHDSIFLGEDGPTHQPVAQLAALRAIPHMTVIRPADARETVAAWETAVSRKGPVALSLTRQDIPVLDYDGLGSRPEVARGAYVLLDCEGTPELIAFATGSEVYVTLQAAQSLASEGAKVRVVSVPSWEIFFEQDEEYRRRILAPEATNRMAVEAASPFGWERFVGMDGEIVGVDRFGESAPWEVIQEKFGFTAKAIEKVMRRRLDRA